MAWKNGSGYLDKTATAAIRNAGVFHRKEEFIPAYDAKKVYEYTVKPIPPKGFETRRPLTYEVFLHYVGYHNPSMGKWVRLKAYSKDEAISTAKIVPIQDKKTEVSYIRRI